MARSGTVPRRAAPLRRGGLLLTVLSLGCSVPTSGTGPTPVVPPPPAVSLVAGVPNPRELKPYALTVSGGVSLGAYEAGLNWVILRYLRSQRSGSPEQDLSLQPTALAAVTGASAGNINALLSAISWCQKEELSEAERVDRNLFWDTWIPVGLDALFPGSRSCKEYVRDNQDLLKNSECTKSVPPFRKEDGLLTRRPFDAIQAKIANIVATPEAFRTPCSVALGVTVSKVIPEDLPFPSHSKHSASEDIKVPVQRFSVLLEASTSDGTGLRLNQRLGSSGAEHMRGLVGNRLLVETDSSGDVKIDHVSTILQASSAFPVAFGPVVLAYCEKTDGDAEGVCDRGMAKKSGSFFDGGLFDNIPLGLAQYLANLNYKKSAPSVAYVFLDPDRARNGEKPKEQKATQGVGYDYVAQLLGSFISVSRKYELQATARFGKKHGEESNSILPTSRLMPTMGHYMAAFGAFLMQGFRVYDYILGVYDGIYHTSRWACDERNASQQAVSDDDLARCLLGEFARRNRSLGLTANTAADTPTGPDASAVVHRLMAHELSTWLGSARLHQLIESLPEATVKGWAQSAILTTPAITDPVLSAIFEANLSKVRSGSIEIGDQIRKNPGLFDIVDYVRQQTQGKDVALSRAEKDFLKAPDNYLWRFAQGATQRLVDMQGNDHNKTGSKILAAAQIAVEAYYNGQIRDSGKVFDPSTVVKSSPWYWSALPYAINIEAFHGGVELRYRPTYYASRQWGLTLPLTVLGMASPGQGGFSERRQYAAAGVRLYRKVPLVLSSVDLGPSLNFDYLQRSEYKARFGLGAEFSFNLMGLYTFALGYENIEKDREERRVMLRLGVNNINGIFNAAYRLNSGE